MSNAEQRVEQQVSNIAKFLASIIFIFLNGLIILIAWNGYLTAVFPSVAHVTYFQACALGVLGNAIIGNTTRGM